MGKGYVTVKRDNSGKYFAQVRISTGGTNKAIYETPEYITKHMAEADAKCWKEFHMTDETSQTAKAHQNFNICENDTVRTLNSRNGVPRKVWTGAEFAAYLQTQIDRFPSLTYRAGARLDHIAVEDGFILAVRRLPTARESIYIITKG